jgi:hypothetical protein
MSTESRYGIEFDFGADLTLSKHFGFVGGAKFSITNLFGKKTDISKLGTWTGKIPLSDDGYVYNEKTVPSKTISFIMSYLGVSFYF